MGRTCVVGANGSGKTALLEAVSVLGNLVSFRSQQPTDWIQRGSSGFTLEGRIAGRIAVTIIRQRLDASAGSNRILHRGDRRVTSTQYLSILPIASFSSHDKQLLTGPPQIRRRFLDRLAFYLHPETYDIVQRYRKLLKQRNALLRIDGNDAQLDAFERDLAFLGARLSLLRMEVVRRLEVFLRGELENVSWSAARPVLRYNIPDGMDGADVPAAAASLSRILQRGRRRERHVGVTLAGPHRHDLEVAVHGVPARATLSAGQGKLLVTALKLAAMEVVARVRGEVPTVVFDDVDAELDGGALLRLLERLSTCPQVLFSSAHEEMVLPRLKTDSFWRMEAGEVRSAGGERSSG